MIDIRPTEPSDLPGIDRLFRERFAAGFNEVTWRWKYEQLPGRSQSWVAVDGGGRVTAHAGLLGFPAVGRQARGTLWNLLDIAGSTRGLGLRPPMVDLVRHVLAPLPAPDDFPWMIGIPNRRHFRLGRKVLNYLLLKEIVPLAGKLPPAGAAAGHWAEAAESAPADSGEIWRSCGVWGIERSAAFLNWRYHARPYRYYRFYRLSEPGGDSGMAVFAFVEREAWGAELWLPEAGDWYHALKAVAVDLGAAGLERWRFWPAPHESQNRLFERLGLELLPRETTLVSWRGRPDPDTGRTPRPDEDFYYAMGDHDAV
ncbi:MAG: hypothetical protein AAF481_06370 [Acidobacteriota bacterium]